MIPQFWLPRRGPFGRLGWASSGGGGGDTLTHGASYTITGSGFGSKATAAPYFYDDFTGGTPDADPTGEAGIVGSAVWQKYTSASAPDFYGYKASQGRRTGKTCFRKDSSGNTFYAPYITGLNATTGYCSFWLKTSVVSGGGVWKFFRLSSDPANPYSGNPALLGSRQPTSDWSYALMDPSAGAEDHTQTTITGSILGGTGWIRVEGWLRYSSALGEADGAYYLREVGGGSVSATSVITRQSPTSADLRISSAFTPVECANNEGGTWTGG